jgi:hypothetical protein
VDGQEQSEPVGVGQDCEAAGPLRDIAGVTDGGDRLADPTVVDDMPSGPIGGYEMHGPIFAAPPQRYPDTCSPL